MEKVVVIGKVEDQDEIRRSDTWAMTGTERMMAIAERMGTWNKPIIRKVEIRKLDYKNDKINI